MTLMNWDSKKFDVLVPQMNEQHEKLVGIMNRLYDRHAAQAGKGELDGLLIQLRDYTIKHFREEESLLDAMSFPQAGNHKLIHKKLLDDFGKHYQEFSGKGSISSGFFSFLRLWLTSHIMHIDRKYGDYAHGRRGA